MKVYFFGVWGANFAGHGWYLPSGKSVSNYDKTLPPLGNKIDGGYAPTTNFDAWDQRRQGKAAMLHLAGWTVLSWWDFTGDRRAGSNSAIVAEGVWGFGDILVKAREYYPAQMARQKEPIVCLERLTELSFEAVVCWKCKRRGRRSVLPGGWSHDPPGWLRREKLLACSPGCAE